MQSFKFSSNFYCYKIQIIAEMVLMTSLLNKQHNAIFPPGTAHSLVESSHRVNDRVLRCWRGHDSGQL